MSKNIIIKRVDLKPGDVYKNDMGDTLKFVRLSPPGDPRPEITDDRTPDKEAIGISCALDSYRHLWFSLDMADVSLISKEDKPKRWWDKEDTPLAKLMREKLT